MASPNSSERGRPGGGLRTLGVALLVFLAVLLIFFHRSFQSDWALFSNDGPLGAQKAEYASIPEGFTGYWQDLNWVGGPVGAAFPSFTYALLWVLNPVGYAKFYEPLCLLALACSAWLFLRAIGLRPAVCVLGGLAAALNSDLFSYTCWGLGSHALAVASVFLALAALFARHMAPLWIRLVMAGLAVGMAVMEGFDSGAILSVYAAAAVLFQALGEKAGEVGLRRWGLGLVRVSVVAAVAGWMAAHALAVLIGTQVQGVVGMQQDAATKVQRWDEATRWSLPKVEVLRLVIAGLHGYRMDTAEGGNYWGAVGRDPAWETHLAVSNPDPAQAPHPMGLRHSGAGFYTGVFVVFLALFALFQAARGKGSAFDREQRRWILFWGGVALVSLLLALGRHAPFYQVVYSLPYFSTIRNPIKFLHPLSLAMVVLCAYGLQAALVHGVERQRGALGAWSWKAWWSKAVGFERTFTLGCGAVFLVALLGWLIYASSQSNLVQHLQGVGFGEAAMAESIARHSVGEVGWFVFFLFLGMGWLTLVRSGFFRGPRAVGLAAVLAGGVLGADLVRANFPWVVYYNYREKYASNPVIEDLREQAYEGRVSALFPQANPQSQAAIAVLSQVYGLDWKQHLFPYYSIQSLDVVQEPRTSEENKLYREAFMSADPVAGLRLMVRQWELTSTRYLVSLAGVERALNAQLDGGRDRFRLHQGFQFYQETAEGPILVATNEVGPFGLLQFTGALPKASLYAQWRVMEASTNALQRLVDPQFDPATTVLLDQDPWPGKASATNAPPGGTVMFEHYAPKRIRLAVEAAVPSVLLLNDKYHPDWDVLMDGEPVELLRANYLMRGVAIPAGRHAVEFRYRPSMATLWVSVTAVMFGLGLCGFVAVGAIRRMRR